MEERTETGNIGKKEPLDVTGLVLVIDVEATCFNQRLVLQQEMEIIQIGAVLSSEHNLGPGRSGVFWCAA